MSKTDLYEEARRKGYHWTMDSACQGVHPDESTCGGHTQLPILQKFIETYCSQCPVAQECLDASLFERGDSYIDDLAWTVRGGYLPTNQPVKSPGRPSKDSAASFAKLKRLEESGVPKCKSGRHYMTPENTQLRAGGKKTCRACRRLTESAARRRKNKCKNGHIFTPDNTRRRSDGTKVCIKCYLNRFGSRARITT